MGIRGEPAATDLEAEAVEVLLLEPPLQEGPGVDAGGGVALDVDVVPRVAVLLALPEVVEPDLVEGGGGGESREVPADSLLQVVGLDHHHRRVPADEPPDAALDVLIARIGRLFLGRDGVDVGGGDGGGHPQPGPMGALEQLRQQETPSDLALFRYDGIE